MSIIFNEKDQTITISTKNSSYQMHISPQGFLIHNYYGAPIGQMNMGYLNISYDRGFSGNPDEVFPDRAISLDTLPQEYSSFGTGDYRISSIGAKNPDGSYAADFRYITHSIASGKYSIPGMPALYSGETEAETLTIVLQDRATGLEAELVYGVFPKEDIITRCVRITNKGIGSISLTRAASICLDFPHGQKDLISFHGKHALERQPERSPIGHRIESISSCRGESSHQQNPFVILCDPAATEDYGDCYGFMLVYSGGFDCSIEKDQFDSIRLVMGISGEGFTWKLESGETFHTPEVIMSYSPKGLTSLSHNYHHIIRHNLCRGEYKLSRRPILINNWEATYFDFNEEKLLRIADSAAELGVEMLVLDDGWFGHRSSDNAGLGDWYVNEEKLGGPLKNLIDKINARGLKFGLWIEPESVNEDSDLYRQHPEWVLQIPGRKPNRSRNQLVLDLSRQDVRDYLFDCFSRILSENNIEYIKWDMNRSLSDLYSNLLPTDRQGETAHRYVLGLYDLMERLFTSFPHVLFEGCSGGGARFDAGILYYSPQIWCSDDTDAIHRLAIQYGTSFGYPVSAVGSHVSAVPNHQTGRITPLGTRGVVAMSGTFGYELDPASLTAPEREMIKKQIQTFKSYYNIIQSGKYYRLTQAGKDCYEAWAFAAQDGEELLLNVVITNPQPNPALINIRLKGLLPDTTYRIKTMDIPRPDITLGYPVSEMVNHILEGYKSSYSGQALTNGGFTLPWIMGDYPAIQIHFVKEG